MTTKPSPEVIAGAPELDANGLNRGKEGSISTWSQRYIDPLHPDPDDVCIEDIAHALARLCRYNGHVDGYLSVARHSLMVSEHVEEDMRRPDLALAALLHDGAEAYLSDVPRPVKRAPELAMFREFDQRMDAAVMTAFGLTFPLPTEIMEADAYVLTQLELPRPHGMRHTWTSTPEADERDFLLRYTELTGRATRPAVDPPAWPLIIGLSGYAQVGKDTVGRVLTGEFGFQRIAFADALRAVVYAMDPLVPNEVKAGYGITPSTERLSALVDRVGWEAAKQNPEVRSLLQRMGTEAGRDVLGADVWVDAAFQDVVATGRYVFTDVRFPNEFQTIKDCGGEVWRIERTGMSVANAHPSETALDGYPFDRKIMNTAGVDALVERVTLNLSALLAGRLGAS